MKKMEVLGLQTIPEIKPAANLPEIIANCANDEIGGLQDRDIIVLTSKIISKATGRIRKVNDIKPGKKALVLSRQTGKDARWLQMIFDEGHQILAIIPLKGVIEQFVLNTSEDDRCTRQLCEQKWALCITKDKDGRIHTCDAGIDSSNHPAGLVSALPADPDKEARKLREQIRKLTGKYVAVVLADTEVVLFGTMDFAVGSAGIEPISKKFGTPDLFGKPKFGGIDLTASELTAASALVFGQGNEGIPVAVIRGCKYEISETENISNTLPGWPDNIDVAKTIKTTMRATACACGLKKRLLLRLVSWFM
jgi:coenzyme F420-0:L-glutamate ligase/coenzyme F420-1:gamma-L-glutamate ligase